MKKLFTLFGIFIQVIANAQFVFCDCDFEKNVNGTYTELLSPTVLNNGKWQQQSEFTAQLGFNFYFLNGYYSTVKIRPAVSAILFGNDNMIICGNISNIFQDKGNATSLSPISHKTDVVNGKKVFKVQFKNMGFSYGDPADFWNYQIWLYEGSNKIEYRFGSNIIKAVVTAFDNIPGPIVYLMNTSAGTVSTSLVNGPIENPTYVEAADFGVESLWGVPANGTIYSFSPKQFTAISEKEIQTEISLSPNPANSKLNIQHNNNSSIESFSLTNVLGEKVLEVKMPDASIDVSSIAAGVYFANIKAGNKAAVKKVLIEH